MEWYQWLIERLSESGKSSRAPVFETEAKWKEPGIQPVAADPAVLAVSSKRAVVPPRLGPVVFASLRARSTPGARPAGLIHALGAATYRTST